MGVSKNSKIGRGISQVPDKVSIKWVKRAKMWARTEFSGGKQTITWHSKGDRPNG